jgi:4-alpha-glucanotransferase
LQFFAGMKTLKQRSSGLLCHLSSLPGAWANGDLGPSAHAFAEWLASAGQSWWQLLPCHPTGAGDSPYQALSAFAGNPLFVSLEALSGRGWLAGEALKAPRSLPEDKADFGSSFEYRFEGLRKAWLGFEKSATQAEKKDYAAFCEAEAFWLDDWALFASLKRRMGGRHWVEWEAGLRDAQRPALEKILPELQAGLRFEKFAQFLFEGQWQALRAKCRSLGLGLIGDMPIFVSHDSADVWARRELFDLDSGGQPTKVAGVPPDYFSEEGQRWGNPLYRWEIHASTGYRWWVARFARALRLFDALRIDHFIGFHRYWEIPSEAMNAKIGHYRPGPGAPFFERLLSELGSLPLIAEDLGVVTPEVTQLRQRFGLPGMRVLQFCFGGDPSQLPESIAKDSAAYTGTHDNNTLKGWLDELSPQNSSPEQKAAFKAERERAIAWASGREEGLVWSFISGLMECPADLALVPLQDLLELGAESRMNMPGTATGNWHWRARPGSLKPETAAHLKRLSEKNRRI